MFIRQTLMTITLIIGLGLWLPTTPSLQAEESVNPGINRHYQDPDFDRWRSTFQKPGSDQSCC